MIKISQYTNLDKSINIQSPNYKAREPEQKILPFEDWNFKQEIEKSHRNQEKNKLHETSFNYPEISPEQIKYRGLNDNELNRLRDQDDSEYRSHTSYYWNKDKDKKFEPSSKPYREIDKTLPDELKKKLLEKYNEFKTVAVRFQEKYKEANQFAAQKIELNYDGSYIDLFKNFAKFIIAAVNKQLGALFGLIQESKNNRYSNETIRLAKFINEGLNLFNITPFNFQVKIHQMDTAIFSMNKIIEEYERRKKILKKLPSLENDVKRYLLKRDNRKFLKWMDEYFPNDKQDFMYSIIESLLETYPDSGGSLHIGDLNKIKTYSSIWWKARHTATHNLYYSMDRKVKYTIEERLMEILNEKIQPKLKEFNDVVENLHYENLDLFAKYVYKNYKLDLRSILQFVNTTFIKYYEKFQTENAANNFKLFKEHFTDSLKHSTKDPKITWKIRDIIEPYIRSFYDHKKGLDLDKISAQTENNLNGLVEKFFKDIIINSLPNFKNNKYDSNDYSFPSFNGIGELVKETGKFSVESVLNYAHTHVPFVPKEFLLNLIKSLFKYNISSNESDINNSFMHLFYLDGTTPATSMKVFLDLLRRSGKFNPNSFTNEFLKSFNQINKIVGRATAEFSKSLKEDDIIRIFSLIFRNTDTIERDIANISSLLGFIHNSAGFLKKEDIFKMAENKNFTNYTKVHIVKKIFHTYAMIKNLNGIVGIHKKYGVVIEKMKASGFISKNFETNIRFILKIFNSGEPINPASPFFKKLFEVTSAMETDLQTIEMGDALSDMLKDYQEKDKRLFDLDLQVNDRLRFRVLKDKDPRMLRVGIESDCCQRIGGVGEVAARDSFVNPLAGVLVLEWKNDSGEWVLLSQSYFHYVPKGNGIILDNVEKNYSNASESGIDLPAVYAYLAKHSKKKLDVGYFLAGKGYSKIDTKSFKTYRLRGGDPRFFDKKALVSGKSGFYSDFSPSDSMDLLAPKFDLDQKLQNVLQQSQEIKKAFEQNLSLIIKYM